MPYGVGIIGAGPGVAALHLPTLARLAGEFSVVHIADRGSGRAACLAERVGARSSSGIDDLLADERVSIVVLCSPPDEHATQILAAVAAGKRAVLCEKPLATTIEDAEAVVAACRDSGTVLIVGTNHLYDAAWGRAKHYLLAGGHHVRAAAVTLALPPNARYHEVVTELPGAATSPVGGPPLHVPEVAASVVRQLITGLAVHDLPIVRDLAPDLQHVLFAQAVAPLGFVVGFRASGVPIRLATVMLPEGADAVWRIDITTDSDVIQVSFPPAFVHVGSAVVTVDAGSGTRSTYPAVSEDGYVAEWRALLDLVNGTNAVEYDEILEDARYSLALADAAASLILGSDAA